MKIIQNLRKGGGDGATNDSVAPLEVEVEVEVEADGGKKRASPRREAHHQQGEDKRDESGGWEVGESVEGGGVKKDQSLLLV